MFPKLAIGCLLVIGSTVGCTAQQHQAVQLALGTVQILTQSINSACTSGVITDQKTCSAAMAAGYLAVSASAAEKAYWEEYLKGLEHQ